MRQRCVVCNFSMPLDVEATVMSIVAVGLWLVDFVVFTMCVVATGCSFWTVVWSQGMCDLWLLGFVVFGVCGLGEIVVG